MIDDDPSPSSSQQEASRNESSFQLQILGYPGIIDVMKAKPPVVLHCLCPFLKPVCRQFTEGHMTKLADYQ